MKRFAFLDDRKSYMLWAVILVLTCPSALKAEGISIVSSTVHVYGRAGDGSYDGDNSGSCIGVTPDASLWGASSSATINTHGAVLDAYCGLISGIGDDWMQGYSCVDITCTFQPIIADIFFAFTGSTYDHCFESYCDYQLLDLTDTIVIDNRHWAHEIGWGWVDDLLPYTADYHLQPNHQYELSLIAHSAIGDMREGGAHMELTITPEPTAMSLLLLGGLGAMRRRRT